MTHSEVFWPGQEEDGVAAHCLIQLGMWEKCQWSLGSRSANRLLWGCSVELITQALYSVSSSPSFSKFDVCVMKRRRNFFFPLSFTQSASVSKTYSIPPYASKKHKNRILKYQHANLYLIADIPHILMFQVVLLNIFWTNNISIIS